MCSLSIPNHAGLVVSSFAGYTRPAWRTCAAVQTPTMQAWRTPAPQGCAWSTLDSYKCSAHLCRPSAPQAPASWGGPCWRKPPGGRSSQRTGPAAGAAAQLRGPLLGRLGLQPDAPSQAPAHLRALWQHSTECVLRCQLGSQQGSPSPAARSRPRWAHTTGLSHRRTSGCARSWCLETWPVARVPSWQSWTGAPARPLKTDRAVG